MASVTVRTPAGGQSGSIELDETWFGIEPNVSVMHQVVTAQLAARRAGTQSTKTRAEVAGGGAKPWKQKGTGRARQGSIRSPQWRGGGVALGPKPRSYAQRTPKKMVRLALRSALSDRAADGKVVVVDEWAFGEPRTRDAVAAIEALGLDGRVLVVLGRDEVAAAKSFRNLTSVQLIEAGQLNTHDVLVNDWVVFTRATLPGGEPAQATPSEQPQAGAAVLERPDASSWSIPSEAAVTDADLPRREKSDAVRTEAVPPAERVKAVTDKEDPKFAAARARAERAERIRARSAQRRSGTPEAAAEAPAPEAAPAQDFSFNRTDEEPQS
jgi:large subunit ribosomal protein L4